MESKKRKLTIKQRKFIDKVIETGNATQAVKETYNVTTDLSARCIGSENLTKPNIKAEIEDRLQSAKNMIWKLSQESKNEKIRLDASKDIVDRVEGKPTQKIETKVDDGQFMINHLTDEQKRRMAEDYLRKTQEKSISGS